MAYFILGMKFDSSCIIFSYFGHNLLLMFKVPFKESQFTLSNVFATAPGRYFRLTIPISIYFNGQILIFVITYFESAIKSSMNCVVNVSDIYRKRKEKCPRLGFYRSCSDAMT